MKNLKILFLISFVLVASHKLKPLRHSQSAAVEALLAAIRQIGIEKIDIMCLSNREISTKLTENILHSSPNIPVLHGNNANISSNNKSLKLIIIFIDSINDLEFLRESQKGNHLDRNGFYLIHCLNVSAIQRKDIFQLLSDLMIYNVNILMDDIDFLNLVTFFPFTNNNCNSIEPSTINRFSKNSKKWKNDKFFSMKFLNMHNCPIKLIGFARAMASENVTSANGTTWSGYDMTFVQTLADHLRFSTSLEMINSESYSAQPLNLQGEILIGNTMLAEITDYISGFPYVALSTSFLTPVPDFYSEFEKLFLPFDRKAWILISCVFIGGLFVISITQKYAPKRFKKCVFGEEVKHPSLSMLNIIVGGNIQHIPSSNFGRYLLIMCLLLCLIIRTAYLAQIFKLLRRNDEKPTIKTIDSAIENGFTFYRVYDRFISENFEKYAKVQYIEDSIQHFDVLQQLNDPKFKGLVEVTFISLEVWPIFSELKLRQVLHDRLHHDQAAFNFPENHFLIEIFNRKTLQALEGGLINYWVQKFFNSGLFIFVDKSKAMGALGMDLIKMSLIVCFIPLILSILTFILEFLETAKNFLVWIYFLREFYNFAIHH